MSGLLEIVARGMYAVLPEWVRLPNLTFELPHAIYWLGLLLFPFIAMYLVRREAEMERPGAVNLPVAYLFWLCGGFVGLHRFYARAGWPGLLYIVLFLLLLFGNVLAKDARNIVSGATHEIVRAEIMVDRHQQAVDRGRSGAEENLAEAEAALDENTRQFDEAVLAQERWNALVGGLGAMILVFLLVDFALLPGLVRRCREKEVDFDAGEYLTMERGPGYDPRQDIHTGLSRVIGAISGWSGTFVAYWSLIAVFVYYYEVIARYVFNSPTNWAHESMFLMFGMQYMLCGAFALREGAHVRVDVIYGMLPVRARAWVDISTSAFFFIFTITLLVTGYIFARNSLGAWEKSFTEWEIQYWPVKGTLVIGAALLALQGLAHLVRDIVFVSRRSES